MLSLKATVSEKDRHLKDVASIIFHEGKLYSGAEDGIIKVWDTDLQLVSEFQAHEVNVYDLAAIGDTLYTCSNDGTVQAWCIDKHFQHKKTLLQSEEEVYKLYVDGGKLYSGNNLGMIGVYENDTCTLMYNFLEEVQDLIVRGNLVYTVRDRDVVISEFTGKGGRFVVRQTLEGSSPMCIAGTKLCFVSRTGIDINIHSNCKEGNFREIAKLEKAHNMIILALSAGHDDATLYSGGWDKTVKCWDLNLQKCVASFDAGCCINTICMGDQGQVYVAGNNGFIGCLQSN